MLSKNSREIPYKYIIFLSALFITIDLAAVSVAYKMVYINSYFAISSAATFIFPMTYCLSDIITEVYGYRVARLLIWTSLTLQFVFAILITSAIHLPSPQFWKYNSSYIQVFGSMIRFVLAGTAANIISSFINIYTISKLKIPMEGKLFWFRSILSTIFGGFIMVLIIIVCGFYGNEIDIDKSIDMFKSTFTLEVIYAFILALPATLITEFLKRSENSDVYDHNTNYNPFVLN